MDAMALLPHFEKVTRHNAATFAMGFLGLPLVLCQQCAMKQKTRQEARLSD
jgi:hypothetical protein